MQTTAAGKDGLIALGGCLALATLIAAALAGILGSHGHHGSPLDWFQSAVVLLGLCVHAAVELHVSDASTDGAVAGSVTAGLTLMPFFGAVLVGAGTYWLGRRSERHTPSGSLRECVSQGAVSGAAFATGAALVALMTNRPLGFGVGASWFDDTMGTTVGVNAWSMLLGSFVVAGLGAVLGRTLRYAHSRNLTLAQAMGPRVSGWAADLRTARALLVTGMVVTVAAVVVAAAWHLVPDLFSGAGSHDGNGGSSSSDDTSWRAVVAFLLGGLFLLGNLLVVATGFVLGGTLGVSGSGDARSAFTDSGWSPHLGTGTGLLAGGVPASYYLVWIGLLLATVVVGMRAAYGRSPRAELAPRVWRTVALFAAAWALLSWLARVGVHISGQAKALDAQGVVAGRAGAGLGIGSTLAAAGVWALICVVAGAFLARWIGAALPRLCVRVAGHRLDPQWALLLADAVARRGLTMPAPLAHAAAALQHGVEPEAPRLDVRPARTKAVLAVAGGLVALAVAAPVGYQLLNAKVFSAQAAVTHYLDAVSQRDAKAALGMVDPSSMRGIDKSLLVPAAIDSPPRSEVVSTKTDGDRATVVVRQHFGDRTRRATFTLTRKGHSAWLFHRWVLEAPFSDLSVSSETGPAAGQTLTVNGVSVPGYGDYPAFPGSYHLKLAKSDYYNDASSKIDVTGAGVAPVYFAPSMNPILQKAADVAVADVLDSCAAEADAQPSGCPLSYENYDYDNLEGVQWTITSYPSAQVSINDDGSVTISTDDFGQAGISGYGTDWWTDEVKPFSDTVDITPFTGTLSWTPGDPSSATMSYDYDYGY